MDSSGLIENYETGLYENSEGQRFVRCEFNPEEPVWIDVSGEFWSATYAGRLHYLDWSKLSLPDTLKASLQKVMIDLLKKNSPAYLPKTRSSLANLINAASINFISFQNGFGNLSTSQWLAIWRDMNSSSRSIFRSLYHELAEKGLAGADFSVAKQMNSWKARNETQTLRVVRDWDVESGSFTSAEWELIRGELNREVPNESDSDCAIRIFGRILNETLKRPQQILSMKRDSLWIAPSGREFFLRIPKAKGQVADRPASWQITETLARAIQEYSARPQINALQNDYDRLIVIPSNEKAELDFLFWMAHGQVDVMTAKERLRQWARKQGIISPRNNTLINLTPYRIRHTGATAMALQGVPREQIQEVLEHDSPESADAYIQSAGSDLIPALEKSTDRGVGKIFSELRNVYFFKGVLIDKVERRPIHIPIVHESISQPAVVGACGHDGICTKHPFWACYNGCPHFLAWRDAPHHKSLEYVESELKRWGIAEGGKERSKLAKDFDRVGAAIHEVIHQIKQLDDGEVIDERS